MRNLPKSGWCKNPSNKVKRVLFDWLNEGKTVREGRNGLAWNRSDFHKGNVWKIQGESGYREYSNEELEAMVEHKKLVGYKLKKTCKKYVKTICKIEGYVSFGESIRDCKLIALDKDGVSRQEAFEKLEYFGVLEKWFEPVYEEELKLPVINGYEGKIEGDNIKYGCALISIGWFEHTENRSIRELTLSSNVKITQSDIVSIKKFLVSLNQK